MYRTGCILGEMFLIPEENKGYLIENVNSGKCMEVRDRECDNGVNVRQWELDDRPSNKLWFFELTSDGYYRIQSLHCRGKFLEIKDANCVNGATARIWEWDSNPLNKQWKIIDYSNGVALQPRDCTARVLEVEDESTENGADIRLWEDDNKDNKRWKITEYPIPKIR